MSVTQIASKRERRAGVVADSRAAILSGTLLLSGIAALVYQVLWIRQLSLLVGVEVYSITVAVSAFFAGLAAGGAFFGRIADRIALPIRLYAVLELAVAVCAVTTTILFPYAAAPFLWMREHVGVFAWILPFLLVGMPAAAMGGTLPVAVQTLRAHRRGASANGGLLYAANTAGGILGALLTSFVLIPAAGVRRTAFVAAALNLIAATVAWCLVPREEHRFESRASVNELVSASTSWKPLTLYAVAGGIALGYEVVWSQAIGQFTSTRAYAFSIVLAVYLAGLAIGSWTTSWLVRRVRDSWGVFGLLIASAGLVAMLEFAALGRWIVEAQIALGNAVLSATGSHAARMYASFAVAGAGMVFVPTLLLGAAFPIALRLMVGAHTAGRDMGRVIAANTAGGIAGTLLTGFVFIPTLGLVRTLGLLAVGAVMVGVFAVMLGAGVHRRVRWAVSTVGFAVIAMVAITRPERLANLLLATRGGGTLVFYEEGRGATVAIAQQQSRNNVFRRLFIQGVSNSGDAMPSMRYMRMQAMLPVLIHDGEPRSVLVVGFGTGITAGETLRYPGLERRVCAELLPAVIRSGQFFPENYKTWDDPRMQIRIRDGRQELMSSQERYDVITLEPPPPSAQGVANLYSTEFYELAKTRLAPQGLFAQWLPIATQNREDTQSLVRSFLDAFPYATLWTTEMHEMLLVGSASPIRLDAQRIEERFSSQTVSASLKAVGLGSPAAVLATWVTGREGLERFAAGAAPVTDDRPRVEYGPWVRPNEIVRVFPELLALKTNVPVERANMALREQIEASRKTLMDFYAAGLAAYDVDQETWEQAMGRVRAAEPENPYYTWIGGRD